MGLDQTITNEYTAENNCTAVIAPPLHQQEDERISYLNSFELLGTVAEAEYDRITRLAAELCGMPISLITLVAEDRQWFKSRYGIEVGETPREFSFCGHTIVSDREIFEVRDTRLDDRFRDNPLVLGVPGIRYYAGVALKDKQNLPLGTLCVVDVKPNNLTEVQREALKALGSQVMNLLMLRKRDMEWSRALSQIEVEYTRIEEFAQAASHDIKSPLNNIVTLSELLEKKIIDRIGDVEQYRMLRLIKASAMKMRELIDGLLQHREARRASRNRETFSLPRAIQDLQILFSQEPELEINLIGGEEWICTHKVTFDQILLNLISNGVKYNQNRFTRIDIGVTTSDPFYVVSVTDNGPGIPREKQDELFRLFHTGENMDRYSPRGETQGLYQVRQWVQSLGGEINLISPAGESGGSRFVFTLRNEGEPS